MAEKVIKQGPGGNAHLESFRDRLDGKNMQFEEKRFKTLEEIEKYEKEKGGY